MKKPKYKIITYIDRKKKHRWRIVHKNGNIIAEGGEGYSRTCDMKRSVDNLLTAIFQVNISFEGR